MCLWETAAICSPFLFVPARRAISVTGMLPNVTATQAFCQARFQDLFSGTDCQNSSLVSLMFSHSFPPQLEVSHESLDATVAG